MKTNNFYCSIILYYYNKNYKYLSIFIGGLLITYFVYTNNPENDKKDTDIINIDKQNKINKQEDKIDNTGVERLENDKNVEETKTNISSDSFSYYSFSYF